MSRKRRKSIKRSRTNHQVSQGKSRRRSPGKPRRSRVDSRRSHRRSSGRPRRSTQQKSRRRSSRRPRRSTRQKSRRRSPNRRTKRVSAQRRISNPSWSSWMPTMPTSWTPEWTPESWRPTLGCGQAFCDNTPVPKDHRATGGLYGSPYKQFLCLSPPGFVKREGDSIVVLSGNRGEDILAQDFAVLANEKYRWLVPKQGEPFTLADVNDLAANMKSMLQAYTAGLREKKERHLDLQQQKKRVQRETPGRFQEFIGMGLSQAQKDEHKAILENVAMEHATYDDRTQHLDQKIRQIETVMNAAQSISAGLMLLPLSNVKTINKEGEYQYRGCTDTQPVIDVEGYDVNLHAP